MFHSFYPAACQSLLWRWYKYFLMLVTTTNSLLLSAGMLDLPLFPFYANPDGVVSSPHSHWGSVKGVSEADRGGMSLGIESGMASLSLTTSLPGCLPLPAGCERGLARMCCDHSDHHPAIMILPFNKGGASIKTAISETDEKTCVLPLHCEQDACVDWDYGCRISVLDNSETILCAELMTRETKARMTWVVAQSVDQNGSIIYQWYDEDGHLHTISEWEYRRRLSMYFQSWLEFLYPEFFGSSLPAGGGWHQWQYWKVRRTADRPENTGQQQWQALWRQPQHNGTATGAVAVVQPVQQTRPGRYQARDQNGWPQPSPSGRATGRAVGNEIDALVMEFKSGYLQNIAARFNKNYDGKKHAQYCSKIKKTTKTRKKPLTDNEKLKFMTFMRHLSEVVYSFNGISLSTCIHSLVASQLLYPPRSTQWQRTALDGKGESVQEVQKTLIKALIKEVDVRAKRQEGPPYGFSAQAISNLLWALAKLEDNGRLQLDQDSLTSQAVMALLLQVVTPPEPFITQEISNMLWALAKLVDKGQLHLDQDGLASQAVTALLWQLQSHQSDFTSQGVSNVLWALAKLVNNGLLQLDQNDPVSEAVTALLPQVVTPPEPFNPQEICNLVWALAKLVDKGRLHLDQDSLASQTVTALLRQVVTPPKPFNPQEISNLLWALAKLVDNERLQRDQDDPASEAVTTLLRQVVTPPGPFNPQEISNLLWALAKLVDNERLQRDQDGPVSEAVTALLPKVQKYRDNFTSQGISNLLWAQAKLVDNGRLQRDQDSLVREAVTALLPQVVNPPRPFNAQEISNLLWALAKLVDNGRLQRDQGGLASQAVTALLPQVQNHQDDFTAQAVSNLLWALVKLVGNGRLQFNQDRLARQAVTALLPQVVTSPGPFNCQEISNQLWALAKLVDNGRLQLDQDSLASQAVMVLLPQVVTPPGPFISQHISNLLWALAKLVDHGWLQLDQGSLASQTVTALLPQVQRHHDDFTSQAISNLLWALAKLVENGLLHLDQGGLANQAVTGLLSQVVNPPGPFIPQHISNLLWALAALGDGIRLHDILNILRTVNTDTIESEQEQIMTLWALTVFLARSGEKSLLLPPMKRLYDALMVEKGNSSNTKASVMWVSGFWLKENLLDLPQPCYESIVSSPHRKLHAELKRNLPHHTLEMEVSVHGLPPVDLLFPDEQVVVEVQGAHHYVDKEKTLRNGSTILKANTYRMLGYKVIEILASDVDNTTKQELLLRKLQTYFLNLELRNNADESDYATVEESGLFSATEEL